jgi:hypothetical protein
MRLFHAAMLVLLLASPARAVTSAAEDPNPAQSDDIQVYNEQNEKLGEANLVIMNEAGQPEGVVVKVNEIGASQIQVIVPVDRIRDATAEKKLVIAATREELKAMPRLQLEERSPQPDVNSHE